MEELETALAALEAQLCLPEVYQDHEKSLQLTTESEELKKTNGKTYGRVGILTHGRMNPIKNVKLFIILIV